MLNSQALTHVVKVKYIFTAGTVALIQQALQLYSAQALGSQEPQSEAEDAVLDHLLSLKEADWISQLESASAQGTISESSFLAAVRRKMERVVLSLPSGSYAQRVQVGLPLLLIPFLWHCMPFKMSIWRA